MDKNYFSNDTIVASATGLNVRSAVSILRVSGPDSIRLASKFIQLKSKSGQSALEKMSVGELRSRYLYRCDVLSKQNTIIDDGLVAFFPGPNSYSGEDMLELHLHGNPLIQRQVIDSIVHKTKARPAERGEFSFRAFKNGKLDLSQVEAVETLISAETLLGVEVAVKSLGGTVKRFIEPIQEDLKSLVASLELELDFSDQDVEVLDWKIFREKLEHVVDRLAGAIEHFDSIRPAMHGVAVSFVGRPNAGKSTLFNALIGEDRSIVSQIQGTTRDVVREQIHLDGLLLRLSDTAGMRDTTDLIEHEGVKRSLQELKGSELVLLIIDSTQIENDSNSKLVEEFVAEVEGEAVAGKVIVVFNKIDCVESSLIDKFILQAGIQDKAVKVSSISGAGIPELRERIKMEFLENEVVQRSPEIFCQRQRETLAQAKEQLVIVCNNIDNGMKEMDLLATDLRSAMTHISELSGSIDSEAILNHIFSNFCIGK